VHQRCLAEWANWHTASRDGGNVSWLA